MLAIGSVQHGASVCWAAAPWCVELLSRAAPAAHAAMYASARPKHAAGLAAASRLPSMTGSVRCSSSAEGPLRASSLASGRPAHSATSSAGPQLATGYHSEAAAAVEQHHHTRPRQSTPQPQHHPSPFHRPHGTPLRPTWVPSSMAVGQARQPEPAFTSGEDKPEKGTGVNSFITTQISQASMLGQLRRLLLRYKAQMEPEHIAVMLDALANVLQQHYPYPPDPLPSPPGAPSTSAAAAATSAPVGRAKWVPPPVPPPAEQLVLAMLGDLGSLAWYALKGGDMAAEDIATVLYSWARMRWHPEPGLLAAAEAALLQSSSLDTLPTWAMARAVRGMGYHKYLTPPVLEQLAPPLQAALPHCSLQQLGDIAAGLAAAHAGGVPKGMPPPAAAAVRHQQQAALQAQQVPLLQEVLHQLLLQLQRHVQQNHQQAAAAGTPAPAALEAGTGSASAPAPAEQAQGAAGSSSHSSSAARGGAWGAVDQVLRALVAVGVPVTPQQLQALQQLLSAAYQQQKGSSSGLQGDAAVLLERLVVAQA